MADWSGVFEQRLQTVLRSDKRKRENGAVEENMGPETDASTPPPTASKRRLHRSVCDPTAAFFGTIRIKQNESHCEEGAVVTLQCRDSVTAATTTAKTPPAQIINLPTSSLVMDTGLPAVRGLQESYSDRAQHLHGEAMKNLSQVQGALDRQLASMTRDEDAFLSMLAGKQNQFIKPATTWTVKIQTQEKRNGAQGAPPTTNRDEKVVNRIAAMRTAAATLENDLKRLWQEWARSEKEVTALLQTILRGDGGGSARGGDSVDVAFGKIIAEAEKEIELAVAGATKEMKDNEKSFRSLILAEECKLAQAMLARQSKYD